MGKLNYLNLELQRKGKDLSVMIGSITSFKSKLFLWVAHLQKKSLMQFPYIKKLICDGDIDMSSFAINLKLLQDYFESRY